MLTKIVVILAATLAFAATGCAARTQIIVWVWSDIPASGTMGLSRLYVRIASAGAPALDHTFTIGQDDGQGHIVRVPGVVVVAYPHDNGASSQVTIDVTPMWGNATQGGALWSRPSHHVVSFRPGHTDLLAVYLPRSCSSSASCDATTQTCSLSGCESASATLSDFDGTYPVPGASTDGGARFCDAGFSNCSGACADLLTSGDHCGSCGHACGSAMVCSAGICLCASGMNCDGGCIDPQSDPANCGSCGMICSMPGQCIRGACVCPTGYRNCDGGCVDENANCGACGHSCLNGTCAGGVCHCTAGAVCTPTQYCCSPNSCC